MFVKTKDSNGKYVGINTDKVISIGESATYNNCREIALENDRYLETNVELDDLIALFNDPT